MEDLKIMQGLESSKHLYDVFPSNEFGKLYTGLFEILDLL